MTTLRTGLFVILAAATAAAAPEYLPLQAGNEWTYRDAASGAVFQIRVGLPVMHQGNAYHKVTGYAASAVFLRAEGANLYGFDEEADREFLFSSFEPVEGAWLDTTIGGCPQGYQPQARNVPYGAAHAWFPQALDVRYRSYSCADTGIERELYVANVGLVRRSVSTIAGPATYDLIHARAGALTYMGEPAASFHVVLDRTVVEAGAGAEQRLRVTLRLSLYHAVAQKLEFASAQRYDIQVRNANGEIVYRWSDDAVYAQAIEERIVAGEAVFAQEIPLRLRGGEPLPPGMYTVEAWLNTPAREFAGAAGIEVRAASQAGAGQPAAKVAPLRWRLRN
ncbi:MAG: hypothetical protein JST11_12990 [Acidobacteria bacterium]|nr:hypothetical protein [Acidobacteriota bacterium]